MKYLTTFEAMNYNFHGKIGAGVLPISKTSGKILLSLRSIYVNEPLTWGIWGGKVDDIDNDIRETAKRELIEETEYSGELELFDSYVFDRKNFRYHNFIGLVDDDFTPKLDSETQDYKWLTLEEVMRIEPKHFGLNSLLKHDLKNIIKYIKKYK